MAATAFVRARIDETLKNEAVAVLAGMGLTVSDVMRVALTKIAKEKALPFEMRVAQWVPGGDWTPNATTIAAMEDVRAGRNLSTVTLPELRATVKAGTHAAT